MFRRAGLAAATISVAGLLFAGCTTTTPTSSATPAEQRKSLSSAADETLGKLYQASPQSKELVARAKGVLIFPDVLSGSFIIGAEHGKGVLRVGGANAGYYSTTAGGFQAGAQSKAMVLLFMTQGALDKFRNSSGWTVGADATVAVVDIGANGRIDTNTAQQPVVGFVMNNGGLMAGVSLAGTKISKIDGSDPFPAPSAPDCLRCAGGSGRLFAGRFLFKAWRRRPWRTACARAISAASISGSRPRQRRMRPRDSSGSHPSRP